MEEDEADMQLGNEDKEGGVERQGQVMRHEEPDEKRKSKGDILWHTRRKGMTKKLVWVIFALVLPVLTLYYLPSLLLLRSEYGGVAPLQPGSPSYQEDPQASSGKAICYRVVNHQSIDSKIFLHCRQGTRTATHTVDPPDMPAPPGENSWV